MSAAALLLAAATAASPQEADFFERRDDYFRSETVEGVSKHAEAATETPATVTILRRDDIERYGFRTVADVLNFASLGNFTHNDRQEDFVGGRGLFFFEDYNTRILVMLDGHPLNEPWNNFAGVGREMLLPLDLVERIEIVYGPSSLLYGGYSLYGIVNVITATGGTLPGARVRVTGGNWGTGEAVASYGASGASGDDAAGTVREWKVLAAAGFYRSRGEDVDLALQDTAEAVRLDGSTLFGGPQSGTDFERAPFAFLHATRGSLSLLARAGHRVHGAPLAPYGTVYGSVDAHVKDSKHFVELRWDRELGPRLALSVRAFHDWYAYEEHDPYADDALYPGEPGYLFALTSDARDRGAEVRATWRSGAHYVTAGAEHRARSITQRSFNRLFGGAMDEASLIEETIDGRLTVLYLQEEWRPRTEWTFVLGGNFADTEPGGRKAQPRVAVIYKPRPKVALKGLLGQGFRPPSIFEASYGDFVNQVANPALRAEEITSGELSAIWNASPRVSAQAYAFKSRLTGLIQGVDITDPAQVQGGVQAPSGDPSDLVGVLQYQSAGDVRSSGIGASLRARSQSWRGYVNVAWARARLERGRDGEADLAGSSPLLGSVGVSWERGAWTAALCARYVGAQDLDPSHETRLNAGSFVDANVRVLRRARLVYPLTLFFDARNVLGSDGALAASAIYTPARVPIEGRRVSLGAELRF